MVGLGVVVKSREDIKFRDKVISSLSSTETDIRAIKSDTERIMKKLDDLSDRVQENEKNISRINGIVGLVFAFFSSVLIIMGWHK